MRSYTNTYNLLSAKAATGIDKVMEVSDFRHLVLAIDSAGNATFTLKVQGSIQTAMPDFAAAQSPTNQWTYLQSIDLADQSAVNGGTGIPATGTDIHRMLEINTNGVKWVTVNVTAYTGGTIYATLKPFNDAI